MSDPARVPPGTLVVEAKARQLHLVQPGGTATPYGVSVGDEAYGRSGEAVIDLYNRVPAGAVVILR